MKNSRFTTQQIIEFIKQADVGIPVADLGRQNGFSPANLYGWRAKLHIARVFGHSNTRQPLTTYARSCRMHLGGSTAAACRRRLMRVIPGESISCFGYST